MPHIFGILHQKLIFERRVKTIADRIVELILPNSKVLDIGCGDGKIDYSIQKKLPSIFIHGIDI